MVQAVTISGSSQRVDRATGHRQDEYLIDCRLGRDQRERLDFNNLEKVDPVEAFSLGEPRRNATKTAVFKAIETW